MTKQPHDFYGNLPWCVSIVVMFATALGCGPATDATAQRNPATQSGVESRAEVREPESDSLSSSSHLSHQVSARKIIYTASIELVVKDYSAFESELSGMVAQRGGFVAGSDTSRRYRNRQSGRWIVRVPADDYSNFLDDLISLGFAESRTENAQDVTEEFVDLEARIANKKRLEQRILAMLDDRTGKLADVLEMERELARVREEIERMEGRFRYLKNQTMLATITIHCREEQEYLPPKTPSLMSRIGESWEASTRTLLRAGEQVLLFVVASMPWATITAVPLVAARWGIRRRALRKES